MRGPFASGEHALLIDQRDRTYLFVLSTGGVYHTHSGTLGHDELIGRPEGTRVTTSKGMILTAFRPRFGDFILKMPRGAQVVYPKDLGPILVFADIFPGARVVEAGTGSGSLTAALCRAVGDAGTVVPYETRPDHAAQAVENLQALFGSVPPQLTLRQGDLAEVGATGERYDRAVLDMPEPWGALEALETVLEPGGVVCAYLPTTVQIQQFVLALGGHGFVHTETFETLKRGWHVTERSVRPEHRMQGHTGFLSVARRVGIAG
ncbi:MAG: tRNA (adenine-N1)-methyltransferase [Thermoplasmata archaeon]|nr:tRNA (adenine-N1)-methyltransferase [Thermoplasmata archaeon]